MTITIAELEERVDRGAKWLDENEPGWRKEINQEYLDMGDCHKCILGQVTGHFLNVRCIILSNSNVSFWDWAKEHGFYIDDEYEGDLAKVWIEKIRSSTE